MIGVRSGRSVTCDRSPGQRWTVRRKAALIKAVRGGWLAIDEACQRYNFLVDEFMAWERELDRYGVHAYEARDSRCIAIPTRGPWQDRLKRHTVMHRRCGG